MKKSFVESSSVQLYFNLYLLNLYLFNLYLNWICIQFNFIFIQSRLSLLLLLSTLGSTMWHTVNTAAHALPPSQLIWSFALYPSYNFPISFGPSLRSLTVPSGDNLLFLTQDGRSKRTIFGNLSPFISNTSCSRPNRFSLQT